MPAATLVDFAETLDLARSLLALERTYLDPPDPVDQKSVAALRGGAAVLMVAALERFLHRLMGESLDLLAEDPLPVAFQLLPDTLKYNSVWSSLELAMSGPRHGAKLGKAARYPDVHAAATRIVGGRIDPLAFAETKGNPGPDIVKAMFTAVGLADVFVKVRPDFDAAWGKAEVKTFLADKLDEIVRRRHRVAHAGDALSISRSDLADSIRFLEVFATVTDAQLSRHIQRIVRAGQRAAKKAAASTSN